ncbi:uncharacterized DUF497 family protein [Silvibacterium bohemicum]|uniref:Uncharacterized DUF497 family protein n=1 Tax=Silvibacterium bohemicum TaxID=1577686 RepID=A0A841K2S4_9BACT|nr:BrnT family toxin [Silvibacterium bohemicum]MBB6146229.1 uncharacterized DUF497 family protein [Silvibacterium bohemicum]
MGRREGQSQHHETPCVVSDSAEIFANEILERIDDREDYGEVRWIALGRANTEVFRVAYTWRGDRLIRIISA